jgi:hypothetical protein
MITQQDQTFHVVCRDCEFEELAADSVEASRLVDDHVADVDHDARYARIQ